jgi:hypothetical protein
MAKPSELFARLGGDAIFHLNIATCKGCFVKPCSLESFLNVHPKVRDVGNELGMRLRLIKSAHDPK